MPRPDSLSLAQARRVAISAQGFGAANVAHLGTRQLSTMARRLGVIQIDSVNVLARAHLLPLFSRLGAYDLAQFQRLYSTKPRRLIEAWAHEASLIPVETWPLLAWRRNTYREYAWGRISEAENTYPGIVDFVLKAVAEHGPLTAAQVHADLVERGHIEHKRKGAGWAGAWNWSVAKRILEYFFWTGEVAAAGRTPQFERLYDLTERVLPPTILNMPIPDDFEAIRALVQIAARAQGIATARDLRDYFRLNSGVGKEYFSAALESLLTAGELQRVSVRGVPGEWYLSAQAKIPRTVNRRALLTPFDPLIWERARLKDLFGVDYRIEIYVPAYKRKHGYYVLPFLDGDLITARVDLKADRQALGGAGVLRVHAAHLEPSIPESEQPGVATRLAISLHELNDWLGLSGIVVAPTGDLAPQLAAKIAGL